jgi:hypothetical protein
MPLGIERMNERVKRPNEHINFIKPLEGRHKAYAQDFLERVAAICNPIMKAHHLYVMSLEEYPANPEFLGRNFNAGEVIQLVLKSRSGHWLPFRFVQTVMMHELAHCKQMNHSGAFWKVNNQYKDELKVLWTKDYTGEGFWSRGITLYSGDYTNDELTTDDVIPEHLCGGTYRSARKGKRKRKVADKPSYKEQKERRIAKKFGTNGVTLGSDDIIKESLEKGKKPAGKPRVAGSNRGRELRAAAALARFEVKKEESDAEQEELKTESESESDYEDQDPTIKTEPNEAIDIDGLKLLDSKGRGMVKVCDDEVENDGDARDELDELQRLNTIPQYQSKLARNPSTDSKGPPPQPGTNKVPLPLVKALKSSSSRSAGSPSEEKVLTCQICSMANDPAALTCTMCSNVLDRIKVPDHWRCQSATCKSTEYMNAGDCGVCGVCGARKII